VGTAVVPASTRRAHWVLVGIVIALVLTLDQGAKMLIRSTTTTYELHEVIGPLRFVNVQNPGVAFGFLGDGGLLVLVLVLAALTLLVVYFARHPERPLLWLPTGLVLGGAFGNLIDRLHQGYVTDFIRLPNWPTFNVADIAITCGTIALVLVIEIGRERPLSDGD